METKTFYAVEYNSINDRQTFDIFPTLKEANSFVKKVLSFGKDYKPLFIFKADFKNCFQEENGSWNYDDYSDTIFKQHKYFKNLI
ncbi:hypothetical protein [Flavobacterium restrictum]|uniref:Uncharacterized protein n=1 Tax=Flavobacterium restrictum TaxID=2594428 RepID=A0A553DQ65_9FLAO|nr:hypothetical protein [Flavobacterium restrictum]TRX34897.1 hypothetical protein FNW21_15865 [Flavobacterium restrictum]